LHKDANLDSFPPNLCFQEILDYRKKILDTSIVSELQMFNAILKWHKQVEIYIIQTRFDVASAAHGKEADGGLMCLHLENSSA